MQSLRTFADAAEERGRLRGLAESIDACEREAGTLPARFEYARIGVEACIKRIRALRERAGGGK